MGRPATHGKSRQPIYAVWRSMLARCQRPTHRAYLHYGGRGIGVCAAWQTFEGFYADMGDAPPGYSLDRIDNDGPYAPGNCRWATSSEQQRNKRDNRRIAAFGITLTEREWSERTGLSESLINWRLRSGWPPERAVSPLVKPQHNSRRVA